MRPRVIAAAKQKLSPINRRWFASFELASRDPQLKKPSQIASRAALNMDRERSGGKHAQGRIKEVFEDQGLRHFLGCDDD